VRKGLRRAGRLTIAAALLGIAAVSPIRGVDALENDPVKYDPTSGKPYSYHADVVMAPTDGGTINTPDECALVTWCTMVPLEITPLDRGEDQDWVVELDVAWNDDKVATPGNVAGSQQANDLDVYLYNVGPLYNEDGTPQTNEDGTQAEGYVETGRSAGGKSPEIIKLFRPTAKNYYLCVINFVGVNQGFDINFTFTDSSFGGVGSFVNDTPPAASPSSSSSFGDSNGRLSYGDTPTKPFATPAPAPVSAPPAFADSDFGFASEVPQDLLQGNEGPVRGSLFAEEVQAPPKDVSGSTLLLWLGLVPIVLVAVAAAVFVKRRPSTLSLRFPVRGGAIAEPVTE
jgi:hypothetical protein